MSGNKGPQGRLFRLLPTRPLARVAAVNLPHVRLLVPLAAACLAGGAVAQTVATAEAAVPPQAMARALALATEAATALAPPGARVTAQPGILNPRLMLVPCAQVEAYLPAGVPAWGRTRVGLRCNSGALRWNIFLPVTVQVWAPAVISTGALPAGARLAVSQLEQAEADWGAGPDTLFSTPQALAGRTLARPLAAGQPVRNADLQPRQWFSAGETVRVLAAGEGYAVAAEGVAMAAGMEGQPVRVRMAGDRVLVGRPVAERQVEVGP